MVKKILSKDITTMEGRTKKLSELCQQFKDGSLVLDDIDLEDEQAFKDEIVKHQ